MTEPVTVFLHTALKSEKGAAMSDGERIEERIQTEEVTLGHNSEFAVIRKHTRDMEKTKEPEIRPTNTLRTVEDLVEQNDNSFDGVINNLPEDAEAGVLGVPFVRFNDFVGKIGYLRELEDVYHLGYGVKTDEVERLYKTVDDLLSMPNRVVVFQERRQKMLSEKIDYAQFLTWFIENYPESKRIMKGNPDYQYRFK